MLKLRMRYLTLKKRYYEVDDRLLGGFRSVSIGSQSESCQSLGTLEHSIPSLVLARESVKKMVRSSSTFFDTTRISLAFDRRSQLEFERNTILKSIEYNCSSFREALNALRKSRHEITAALKLAEMKLIVQFQEYQQLQTFETKDIALQNKKVKCQKDKDELVTNLSDFQSKLENKFGVQKDWLAKISVIANEMVSMVPESNQYHEILTKIFRKKVKYLKPKDDEEEEEDDESEEEDEDEDEDEDEEVEDICPPGCDKALYEKVLRLRENRAEQEDQLNVVTKSIDELKKNIERMKTKEKQIDKDIKQTDMEIEQFHAIKQSALNIIPVSMPLQVSQIYPFLESGVMSGPEIKLGAEEGVGDRISSLLSSDMRTISNEVQLSSHVLIQKRDFDRLHDRIGELAVEIERAKADLKTLHKQKKLIERSLKVQVSSNEEKKSKVYQVQLLKFGREVDIDQLEQMADRSLEHEIENNIVEIEEDFRSEQSKLLAQKGRLTDSLVEITKRNTGLLQRVADMTTTKIDITRELNHVKVDSTGDSRLAEIAEKQELERLTIFMRAQEKELNMIKSELNLLKRKDVSQSLPYIPPAPMYDNSSLKFPPIHHDRQALSRKLEKKSTTISVLTQKM